MTESINDYITREDFDNFVLENKEVLGQIIK
jgi:hypothetical protein